MSQLKTDLTMPGEISKPVPLDEATLASLQSAGMADVTTVNDLSAVKQAADALPGVQAERDGLQTQLAKAQSDLSAAQAVETMPKERRAAMYQQVRENAVKGLHAELDAFVEFRRNQLQAAWAVVQTGVDADVMSLADAVAAFVGGG